MTFEMLKGKIHRATVVQAELDYVGSITVDEDLLDSAGILEYENGRYLGWSHCRLRDYQAFGKAWKRGAGLHR